MTFFLGNLGPGAIIVDRRVKDHYFGIPRGR